MNGTMEQLFHELLTLLSQIRDELRVLRQALPPSPDIEGLIALHQRTKASYAEVENVHEGAFHP